MSLARVAAFWAALLGRPARHEPDGVLLAGDETQVGLRFVPGPATHQGRQLHLQLTSARPGDQRATVAKVLDLGGGRRSSSSAPGDDHVVVTDPEGNPFCVIEAGNSFLAGCVRRLEGCGDIVELADLDGNELTLAAM